MWQTKDARCPKGYGTLCRPARTRSAPAQRSLPGRMSAGGGGTEWRFRTSPMAATPISAGQPAAQSARRFSHRGVCALRLHHCCAAANLRVLRPRSAGDRSARPSRAANAAAARHHSPQTPVAIPGACSPAMHRRFWPTRRAMVALARRARWGPTGRGSPGRPYSRRADRPSCTPATSRVVIGRARIAHLPCADPVVFSNAVAPPAPGRRSGGGASFDATTRLAASRCPFDSG